MQPNRDIRPYVIGTPVSRTMFAIIRVLIASYFLATATGLILEPGSRTFFDGVLPADSAAFATTMYLFVTAFAIMVGKLVRPASLLLALYIFWSAFVHFELGSSPAALGSFWRDMALLGAVLLVAVTEPGGSDSFRLWRRGVAPRRIVPQRPALDDNGEPAATPRPAPTRPAATRSPQFASARAIPVTDIIFDDDADEAEFNIFADLWDAPEPRST